MKAFLIFSKYNFPVLEQGTFEYLTYFKNRDFTKKANAIIVGFFYQHKYDNDINFFLVCGIAQLKIIIPELKKKALNFDRAKKNWFSTTEFYSIIALIRMGDFANLDNIIAATELELDANIRVLRLLKYLAYTLNSDCMNLMSKYLSSLDRIKGFHGLGDTDYGEYIVGYLSTYLEDFPVKFNYLGYYTKDEIETTKVFLKKYNR